MRKMICTALLLALVFTACGEDSTPVQDVGAFPTQDATNEAPTQTQESPQTPGTSDVTPIEVVPDAVFSFSMNGAVIHMDMEISQVTAMLGEPNAVFEQPSCAFDGIDRVFSFPGVQFHTYPVGDLDFLHTINIRDDSVATENGIFLGSSLSDVISAYGNNYAHEFGMFTFTRGLTRLSFFIENDMVVGILYELDLS